MAEPIEANGSRGDIDVVDLAAGPRGEADSENQHQELAESLQASASKAPPRIPLDPPEDCVVVTQDGGVLKKVLEAGEPDSKPTLHARCLIHYIGYLASNGEQFMDTRTDKETDEPVVVVAGRNASATETGLCLAAATMCRGERALVYVQDPAYGYGPTGSFSFPCVPPNSRLAYEMELIDWEGIDEMDNDNDRGSLLYEERLERAQRRRVAGNELFKDGQLKEALAKYALALSYLDEDFMFQLEGRYLDDATAVKRDIHLNMAAVQLKTQDYNTAIYNCGQVLQMDSRNVKALLRRARAQHKLGRTEEALADLEAAKAIDPNGSDILHELTAVKATMREEQKATAAMYRNFIKPTPIAKAAAAAPAPAATPGAAAGGSSSAAPPAGGKQEGKDAGAGGAAAGSAQPAKRPAAAGASKAVGKAVSKAQAPAARRARKALPAALLGWILAVLRRCLLAFFAFMGLQRSGRPVQQKTRAR